ncbi:MAG: CPXCG motif-containing cysteine-rich protein [Verrucomicrobiota bacterium]|nr:CPXCG motif-containing cysteine-rich protein [Verrucomicrobiota bacterium]
MLVLRFTHDRCYGPTMDLIVEADITCPHCGEVFPLEIDTSQRVQEMIEDCSVCCRPINLTIRCRPGEIVELAIAE